MSDLHHPCEHWAESVSLAAAGCLPSDEEQEVRRHVETCSDCREQFRQLTELCRALAEAPLATDSTGEAIIERIMSAFTADVARHPDVRTRAEMIHPPLVFRSLDIWTWIMRSPASRLSAAAVLLLAIGGIATWFHGSGATPAAPSEPLTTIAPIVALPPQVVDPDVTNEIDAGDSSKPVPPQSQTLFRDEFCDLANSRGGLYDGKLVLDSKRTRAIGPFAASQFKGRLALTVAELSEALGADSRPGVLRVEWEHIPESIDYSGFRYQGRIDPAQRILLPQIMTARTPEDFRGFTFRAKFKAVNKTRGDEATIKFDLRIEPVEDRSYDNRLDFGTIEASSTWKAFEIDLADAKNGERFVESFARRGSGLCALIFAQAGSIDDYHDGDGLLIDDIEILDQRNQ